MPESTSLSPAALPADLYGRLRAVAARYLSRERRDHTLQPTALANEAYARLLKSGRLAGMGREELVAAAAQAMRRVLVDHARRRRAAKRAGSARRVPLDEALSQYEAAAGDLIDLESALKELERREPGLARIVELRFFGGLTEEEVAAELGVSDRTVRRGWSFARLWLAQRLRGSAGDA